MKTTIEKVNTVLKEHFELKDHQLKPEAHLFRDLGLDSLDSADLIVQLEEMLDSSVNPKDFYREDLNLGHVYENVNRLLEEQTHK